MTDHPYFRRLEAELDALDTKAPWRADLTPLEARDLLAEFVALAEHSSTAEAFRRLVHKYATAPHHDERLWQALEGLRAVTEMRDFDDEFKTHDVSSYSEDLTTAELNEFSAEIDAELASVRADNPDMFGIQVFIVAIQRLNQRWAGTRDPRWLDALARFEEVWTEGYSG